MVLPTACSEVSQNHVVVFFFCTLFSILNNFKLNILFLLRILYAKVPLTDPEILLPELYQ